MPHTVKILDDSIVDVCCVGDCKIVAGLILQKCFIYAQIYF